ncbi:hypothetical protein BH09MYX1_BH09MYX1_34480 [soil metagenome]
MPLKTPVTETIGRPPDLLVLGGEELHANGRALGALHALT